MEGLELPFYSLMPVILGSPSFLLPLRCPVKGYVGDVAWLSTRHMSDHLHHLWMMMMLTLPSLQQARRCLLEMVSVQNICRIFLGVEGRQFEVTFNHRPAF